MKPDPVQKKAPFRVADHVIDPARNRIADMGVEPKVMDLLCVLASEPGRVFSRDELIARVWNTRFGADESLTRAISQLRKAFGESREDADIVETISKRGYRLRAQVTPAADVVAPAAEAGQAPQPAARRTWLTPVLLAVAVLGVIAGAGLYLRSPQRQPPASKVAVAAPTPGMWVTLAPLSVDGSDAALSQLAQALRENLVINLSRASLIHVRTSGDPDRDRDYHVQGSVRKLGDSVRVNVQLVDPASRENIWSANYDRPVHGDFPAQDQFANAIAPDLVDQISNAEKLKLKQRSIFMLAPWELNLLATWTPGSEEVPRTPPTRDAFWPQRRAIALDPKYALAHATLASALAYHAMFNPPENTPAALAEGREQAAIAISLAPFDPEVVYQLGYYYRLLGDRENALKMLRRVLELRPDDMVARIDMPFVRDHCTAGSAHAISELRAIDKEILPSNPVRRVLLSHLADLYLARGDMEPARQTAADAWAIVAMTWPGITLAAAQVQTGRVPEGLTVAAQTKLQWPALDFRQFARQTLPRWCLGGPESAPARGAFLHLGQAEASAKPGATLH